MQMPTSPIRVLELRSVRGTGGGPDKTILLGARHPYRSPIAVTVCYIRDRRDDVFAIDRQAARLGIDYEEIHERHSFDWTVWPALRAVVKRRGIHIVHAHDYKTDLAAWALARRGLAIPLSTAHGWAGVSARERFYYRVEKQLLAYFPRVIAVSSPIKAELIRAGCRPDRIVLAPNAINHREFVRNPDHRESARHEFGFGAHERVIGAVGRLESEKRFDLLLEAFARIHARWPWSRLLIAGEGRCRMELERIIDRLGLADVCRLLGHRSDISRLHHALDLFVQSSEREGTPNAVLEAMAFETPLVVTDAGGTSDLVSDGVHALVVPRHDVSALARALESALADPQASRMRASAARRHVETELSFERRMDRVEAIYRELMTSTAQRDVA
jgi:glycosyltransferase involved in cell wall biosynthesis